jgi:hypothetical protein
MRRLNVDMIVGTIDPTGTVCVTREHERVDDTIIVQDANLEIAV